MMHAAILSFILLAQSQADQVILNDGGRLSGSVAGLDSTQLELGSPLTANPIKVRLDRIREVSFPEPDSELAGHGVRLQLINGDVLPCDVVSIDSEKVSITTNYSSPLTLSRDVIETMQLGIRPRRVIYRGPESADDLADNEAWNWEKGLLVSQARGPVSLPVPNLPDSFALQFDLAWKGMPNFEIYLCSNDSPPGRGKLDRYRLQFRNTRIKLDRQSAGENTYLPLGEASFVHADFPSRRATVEIRVDRPNRKLRLYLDGKAVTREISDRLPAPDESTLIFNSSNSDPGTLTIGPVIVRAWNSSHDRQSGEERGDPAFDTLFDDDGNRFSGQLLNTGGTGSSAFVSFKSPHQPKPLEIPIDRVSTIFFSDPAEAPKPSVLLLGLPDGGRVSATACQFAGDEVSISHPLIGEFSTRRDALRKLGRRKVSQKPEPTSAEP